jgi:exopolyphosphatase/guanosine-5'-triphosphate,3'-diphosphate pyrophosphatase
LKAIAEGPLLAAEVRDAFVAVAGLAAEMSRARAPKPDAVHALRVALRRASAACELGGCSSETLEDLRAVRRASGPLRDCDVAIHALSTMRKESDAGPIRRACAELIARLRRERPMLVRALRDSPALLHLATPPAAAAAGPSGVDDPTTVAERLERLVRRVARASRRATRSIKRCHRLRVRVKVLRYAVELLAERTSESRAFRKTVDRLAEVQHALGRLHDASTLSDLISCQLPELPGLRPLARHAQRLVERRYKALQKRWTASERDALGNALAELAEAASLLIPRAATPTPSDHTSADPAIASVSPAAAAPTKVETIRVVRGARPGSNAAGLMPRDSGGSRRLAAIDIGSNSIRLIVAEAFADGSYRVLDDEKEVTRLGSGVGALGRMSDEGIDRTTRAVDRMRRIAEGYNVDLLRAVATSATRESTNGEELIERIARDSGVRVEVISAEEEAWLAYRSVSSAFDLSSMTMATVDIGGGSTEVVLASAGAIERIDTLDLGAVKITERFGGAVASSTVRYKEMCRWLDDFMARHVADLPAPLQLLIGTGGTVTTLGAMALNRARKAPEARAPIAAVQGFEVKRSSLASILEDVREVDIADRLSIPGLGPDRADIIVAGLAVLRAIMRRLDAKRVRVHEGGIRDGLLLTMAGELFPSSSNIRPTPGDPLRAVRRFAQACRYDQPHSEHVADLAVRILDQLVTTPGLIPIITPDSPDITAASREASRATDRDPRGTWSLSEARLLVRSASLLLDVGYIINYDKHHIHSYNLIAHADLPGLSRRQVELIAAIARYHRGASPRSRHECFERLRPAERQLVRVLSSIVRLAVGLDRTHTQTVTDVRVRVDAAARAARFEVHAPADPAVDIWGAERKSPLFAEVFALAPTFVWQQSDSASKGTAMSTESARPHAARAPAPPPARSAAPPAIVITPRRRMAIDRSKH